MSKNEEEIKKLVYEYQVLQGLIDNLRTREALINNAINELQVADATLDGLKNENEPVIFIPIGGGSYVKAKITDTKKVVIGIGAGVSTEKNIDDAKTTINSRILDLENGRKSLEEQLEQVLNRANNTREKIQKISELNQ